MIITNGYLRYVHLEEGGMDATTGHPISSSIRLGRPIPCQYVIKTADNLARSNDEAVKKESYQIYIETCQREASEVLRLFDTRDKLIGEFAVTMEEPLDAVGQIRIHV